MHFVSKPLANGTKRWYVYAYRGGPCIHKCDGARPVIDADLFDKARNAGSPDISDTISGLIHHYEQSPEYKRTKPKTKESYDATLKLVNAEFGTAKLAAFDDRRMRTEVMNWRNRFASSPRMADIHIEVLNTLLSWGVTNGYLVLNVAKKIPKLYHSDRSELIWEPSHFEQWNQNNPVWDAIELSRMTGLRKGDLLKADWEHVRTSALIIETGKRDRNAVIPIFDDLRDWLDARLYKEGKLLRRQDGNPWTYSGFNTAYRRARPDGFDRNFHDLRGTNLTWLCEKGLTDDEIARIAAWATRQRIADLRARYVDQERVVVSIVERLSA